MDEIGDVLGRGAEPAFAGELREVEEAVVDSGRAGARAGDAVPAALAGRHAPLGGSAKHGSPVADQSRIRNALMPARPVEYSSPIR
jgi:hypothetical protein